MSFKLVKTAAAIVLGASVVTTSVALPGAVDASAASKYKVVKGQLVSAKTGKVVKGFVTFKKVLYKEGKKFTGLKGKIYYKAGAKATGTYKGAYYVKGAKKVTTGTYNKAYYVKGKKVVTTGIFANKYYKEGKVATGTYKGAYYVNGVKKVTTGTYNKAYYVAGKKVVTTGLYKEELYKEGKLNEGLALFEEKLYDGATFNKGVKAYKNDKGVELFYNNEVIADGTFVVEGKELAFEKGIQVEAKVKSYKITYDKITIEFNKTVNKEEAIKLGVVVLEGATIVNKGELSEDGRTLTIGYTATEEFKNAKLTVDQVLVNGTKDEKTAGFIAYVNFVDTVAPQVAKVEKANVLKTVDGKDVQFTNVKFVFNKNITSYSSVSVDGTVISKPEIKDGNSITIQVEAGKTANVVITDVTDVFTNKTEKIEQSVSTAKDEEAPKLTFSVDGTDVIIVSTKTLVAAPQVSYNNQTYLSKVVVGKENTYTVDLSDLVKTTTFVNDVQLTVQKESIKDALNNTNKEDITSGKMTIKKKEKVEDKVVSSSISADGKTITVNYDKELTAPVVVNSFKYTRVNNNVNYGEKIATVNTSKLSNDKKSVIYTLTNALEEGTVTVIISENITAKGEVKYEEAYKKEANIEIIDVKISAKNVITVNFKTKEEIGKSLDLTDAAINASNFELANAALPEGTVLKFVNNKQTIQIELPASYAVANNKDVTFRVKNVEDVKGNTLLDTNVKVITLSDNVAPTTNGVAKADNSKQATITFSENLKAVSTISGVTVKVNGTTVDASKYTLEVAGNKLTVKLVDDLKEGSTVSIELAKDTNLTDENGNAAIVIK